MRKHCNPIEESSFGKLTWYMWSDLWRCSFSCWKRYSKGQFHVPVGRQVARGRRSRSGTFGHQVVSLRSKGVKKTNQSCRIIISIDCDLVSPSGWFSSSVCRKEKCHLTEKKTLIYIFKGKVKEIISLKYLISSISSLKKLPLIFVLKLLLKIDSLLDFVRKRIKKRERNWT